jgi:hypothetical protein
MLEHARFSVVHVNSSHTGSGFCGTLDVVFHPTIGFTANPLPHVLKKTTKILLLLEESDRILSTICEVEGIHGLKYELLRLPGNTPKRRSSKVHGSQPKIMPITSTIPPNINHYYHAELPFSTSMTLYFLDLHVQRHKRHSLILRKAKKKPQLLKADAAVALPESHEDHGFDEHERSTSWVK